MSELKISVLYYNCGFDNVRFSIGYCPVCGMKYLTHDDFDELSKISDEKFAQ